MSELKLVLATPDNGLMDHLIREWDAQLKSQKLPKSVLDAVRSYEVQIQPDKTYGVYVLCRADDGGKPHAPYEAFVHINHAFPKTKEPTLRLTWSRLAPKFEWATDPAREHARMFSSIFTNALLLAEATMHSREVKIYLYRHEDRAYARQFVSALTGIKVTFKVAVRGNWLHFWPGEN